MINFDCVINNYHTMMHHMSENKITKLCNTQNIVRKNSFKPTFSFWYSPEREWENWCHMNIPTWVYKHFYEVNVDDCNMLKINNTVDLMKFDEKFGDNVGIRWNDVCKIYDGIQIMTEDRFFVVPTKRLEWYSHWGIPSGCVWNTDNMKIKYIEK